MIGRRCIWTNWHVSDHWNYWRMEDEYYYFADAFAGLLEKEMSGLE